MLSIRLLATLLSLIFFLTKLSSESQDQKRSNNFITTQQSSNSIFTIITTSRTNDFLEPNGSVSLLTDTVISYIFDTFVFTFTTTAMLNSSQLFSIKTDALSKTNINKGIFLRVTKDTQLECMNFGKFIFFLIYLQIKRA